MELYAPSSRVAAIKAELALVAGAARTPLLVELAWHLRQRDSARALRLADEAAAALDLAPPSRQTRAPHLRLALTRCEVATLFCRIDEAEHWLARAREDVAAEPDGATDALLAEALVARARGQRQRAFDACGQAVASGAQGFDPARAAATRALLVYEQAFGAPGTGAEAGLATARRSHVAVDALLSTVEAIQVLRREPARAVELFLHASEQAQRVGLVRDAVVATVNAGTTLRGLGEHEKAAACFDISESVARRTLERTMSLPVSAGSLRTA